MLINTDTERNLMVSHGKQWLVNVENDQYRVPDDVLSQEVSNTLSHDGVVNSRG